MQDCVSLCFRVCIPIHCEGRGNQGKGAFGASVCLLSEAYRCTAAYYLQMLEEGEENDRVVCDYIAGIDRPYAVAKYNEYFMPKSWQVY